MRKTAIAAALALVAAVALGLAASPASAQAAQLNFVHSLTYDYPTATLPVSLCVDEVLVDADVTVGEVVSPIDVSAPTAHVEVYQGVVADCTGVADFSLDPAIGAGEDVTVVAYWSVTEGPTLGSFVNDQSCVEAGSARLAAFQGADYGGASVTDVYYSPQMTGNMTLLFADLANGTVDQADVVAGNYDAGYWDTAADPDVDPSLGEINPVGLPEGTSAVMFLAGGNDGESGAFVVYSTVPVCTPSTTATSATTPASATGAAAVTPAFTG